MMLTLSGETKFGKLQLGMMETLKSAMSVIWDDGLLSPKLHSSDLRAFQMSCTEIKTDTLTALGKR